MSKPCITITALFLLCSQTMAFELTSTNFTIGTNLPVKHVLCKLDKRSGKVVAGQNNNPQFAWSNPPTGTKSFVLTMRDPDVPTGVSVADVPGKTIPKDIPRISLYHWIVTDIPANVSEIKAGSASTTKITKGMSVTELRKTTANIVSYHDQQALQSSYLGPCGANNDEMRHHYTWDLIALDVASVPKEQDEAKLEQYIAEHKLGETRLVATYSNNPQLATPKALSKADVAQIEHIIVRLDQSFRNYSAHALVSDMAKDMTFVNQFGRYYTNRQAVEDRHAVIFDKTHGGHLGLKPPAIYTIEKINMPANNVVSLIVNWEYPPFKGRPTKYDPHDPMSGIFGIQMVKVHGKWTIFSVQNTPATPVNINAEKKN